MALKSDEELAAFYHLGYDGITIGVETGDDRALAFMDKGYRSQDIVDQAARLLAADERSRLCLDILL